MTKQLTDMQQKFLDVLFEEAGGDAKKASVIAGYAENTSVSVIMKPIQAEIGDKLRESLGTVASIKAYQALVKVLDSTDDPLGRKERILVAKDFLDRAGFKPTDKVEVTGPNPLFILPPKDSKDGED